MERECTGQRETVSSPGVYWIKPDTVFGGHTGSVDKQPASHSVHSGNPHISRGHSLCANTVGFDLFPGVFELFIRCAKISFPWWGYMYTF